MLLAHWQATQRRLIEASPLDPVEQLGLAGVRGWLLDELELRDPEGFGYWIHLRPDLSVGDDDDPWAFFASIAPRPDRGAGGAGRAQ